MINSKQVTFRGEFIPISYIIVKANEKKKWRKSKNKEKCETKTKNKIFV